MDKLKAQFIVFLFITNIKYSQEPPLSCRWDFSKSSWCPSYSTEYTSQWQTQARCLNCPMGTTYHCARVLGENEKFFKEQCAVTRDCIIGTEPRIGLHDSKVTCENCHNPDRFNDYDSTLSSTFSECQIEKTICIIQYHRIECERSPKFSSENRYCRCDARNNYVFSSGQPNKDGCTNSLSMKCSSVPPCPDGKDRSVKGDSRTCLEHCQPDYYRPNDSDDCLKKNPDLPDDITTVPSLSSSISHINTTILPPVTTSLPQDVSPPIQGKSLSTGVIAGITVAGVIGLLLVLIGGICLLGHGLKFCGFAWLMDQIDDVTEHVYGHHTTRRSSYSLAPTKNPDQIPKPANVTVKRTTLKSITLSWDNCTKVDKWLVTNKEEDNAELKAIAADPNSGVRVSTIEAEIDRLKPGHQYKLMVQAKFEDKLSEGVDVQATTIPKPVHVEVKKTTSTAITLAWHNSSGVDSWQVINADNDKTIQVAHNNSESTVEAKIKGLQASHPYKFIVKAKVQQELSEGVEVEATTKVTSQPDAPPPQPPTQPPHPVVIVHGHYYAAQHNITNIDGHQVISKGKNSSLYLAGMDKPENKGGSSSTSSPTIQQQTSVPEEDDVFLNDIKDNDSKTTNKEEPETRYPVPITVRTDKDDNETDSGHLSSIPVKDKEEPPLHCHEKSVPPIDVKKEEEKYSIDQRCLEADNKNQSKTSSWPALNTELQSTAKGKNRILRRESGRSESHLEKSKKREEIPVDKLKKVYQKAIDECSRQFNNDLRPDEILVDFQAVSLFPFALIRTMREISFTTDKNTKILDFIRGGGVEKYCKFKTLLSKFQHHLVEELEKSERQLLEQLENYPPSDDDTDHSGSGEDGDAATHDGHDQESSLGDMISLGGRGDVYSQGISNVLDESQIGSSGDHYKDGEDVKDSEPNASTFYLPKATLPNDNKLHDNQPSDLQIKPLKDANIVFPENMFSEKPTDTDKRNGTDKINHTLHIEINKNGNKMEETDKNVKYDSRMEGIAKDNETDCAESLKENKPEDDNKAGKTKQKDNNVLPIDKDCEESLVPPYEPKNEKEWYSDDRRPPDLKQNDLESGSGSDENNKDATNDDNDADNIDKQVCPPRLCHTAAQLKGVYKKVLKKLLTYLIEHMVPIILCDKLIEFELFPYVTIRDIKQKDNDSNRNREIWELVHRGGSEKYIIFKECLDSTKQYNIVEELEKLEVEMINMPDEKNDSDEDKVKDNSDDDDDYESSGITNDNGNNDKSVNHETTNEDMRQSAHSNDVGENEDKPVQENHPDTLEEESSPESSYQPHSNSTQQTFDEGGANAKQQPRFDQMSEQPVISADTNNDDEAMEMRVYNFLKHLHKIATEKKPEEFESSADQIKQENLDLFTFPFQQVQAISQPYLNLRNCPSDFQAFKSSGADNSCLYQSISLLLSGSERYQHRLRLAATVHAVRHRMTYVKHHLQLLEDRYGDATSLTVDNILSYFSAHLPDNIVAKCNQSEIQPDALIENFVFAVIMDTAKLGSESSELQVLFLADVLNRCIHQYFQKQTAYKMDNKVVPAVGTIEHDDLCIMWVNVSDDQNGPLNHIVPLLKKNKS